ncbi:OB-fold domain-containing protein [Bradyrhizobium sp. LHD-71]|uniref:Zn-ribbon domain-containing OB-fold protein n=1 Tax=Bradyrhizobium sp. LHD-71 TaxID=3072141 RepID=UPI00280FE1FC|nr:OB-fold domain-containing protein [Bradyrhizobium sp. LHD-71]MDQ8731455.1 OB-fold domain-containing protein [Bradyrhizobium sp. LHD-71]
MNTSIIDETTGRYLPIQYPEEMPFWKAAQQRRLVLQRCDDCRKVLYPIGPTCPHCGSNKFTWSEMSGRGVVHNFVVYHKPWVPYYRDRVPYALVQVQIEEGPRLTTNLHGVSVSDVRIGMEVEATWEELTPGVTLLQFKPRGGK